MADKILTLAELQQAYQRKEVTLPVSIDNDQVATYIVHDPDWVNVDKVYDADPGQMLEDALDLLGIPWEHV